MNAGDTTEGTLLDRYFTETSGRIEEGTLNLELNGIKPLGYLLGELAEKLFYGGTYTLTGASRASEENTLQICDYHTFHLPAHDWISKIRNDMKSLITPHFEGIRLESKETKKHIGFLGFNLWSAVTDGYADEHHKKPNDSYEQFILLNICNDTKHVVTFESNKLKITEKHLLSENVVGQPKKFTDFDEAINYLQQTLNLEVAH